uniref:NADH-ubiquinone oxidoreductase chain 4 n=1 Tax=Tamerlania zarudnyi TaxID=138578 RepID=A0A894JTE1_9TREM|nr:NADH dehydrogenase subunit 4 [Tamerlania zarudnyi]QRV61242.1 NADH dehydrogenase subunit 4 [Tamerlania zarudnyi]
MGFRWYSWFYSLLSVGVSFFVVAYFMLFCLLGHSGIACSDGGFYSEWFCYDDFSFYMTLSSVFFVFLVLPWNSGSCDPVRDLMLVLSLVFSMFCYCTDHGLWFWVCYEMSILPLLYLVIWHSPYSERYAAFLYFSSYLVFTSLPVLVGVLWFSSKSGFYNAWGWCLESDCDFAVMLIMAIAFITKIPLPPFHSWLPVVHAEASTEVSICLSGYVMKLGIVGIYRLCNLILPDGVFCFEYVGFVLLMSLVFFFCAMCELDSKRWLAFLSLGHIAVVPLGLYVVDFESSSLVFIYCLGHGVAAAFGFKLLGVLSSVSGSRNWLLLKGVSGGGIMRYLVIWFLLVASGLPPTLQFFGDVGFIMSCGGFSFVLFSLMAFFIFVGGLTPMLILGNMLTRCHGAVIYLSSSSMVDLHCLIMIAVWNFALFLVC